MSARSVAMARIARAARCFPELAPRASERQESGAETPLDTRDAALASAIEHNVLRRWLTLATVIESQLSRPWTELEAKMQAALLCGSAQLLLMDRLPDYAVIDESVEWAKRSIRPKAGTMANAVLRKIAALRSDIREAGDRSISWNAHDLPLSDGRVLRLTQDVFASDSLNRCSQQTSHALELLDHWVALLGAKQAATLAAHGLVHAPVILHGIDADAAASAGLTPHQQEGFWIVESAGHANLTRILQEHPSAIVQDPASAAVVNALKSDIDDPALIIDACAGRGTKTRQLAQAFPSARIVATDVDPHRLDSLRASFGHSKQVEVVRHQTLLDFAGRADLVLLDVPCSNTGVLARRVEARHRFTRASLQSLVELQRQIIADALRLITHSGYIAYATCSIDPAENQEQARWVTQWHPFDIVNENLIMPCGLPGEPPQKYSDGGYRALLRRRASRA